MFILLSNCFMKLRICKMFNVLSHTVHDPKVEHPKVEHFPRMVKQKSVPLWGHALYDNYS